MAEGENVTALYRTDSHYQNKNGVDHRIVFTAHDAAIE